MVVTKYRIVTNYKQQIKYLLNNLFKKYKANIKKIISNKNHFPIFNILKTELTKPFYLIFIKYLIINITNLIHKQL